MQCTPNCITSSGMIQHNQYYSLSLFIVWDFPNNGLAVQFNCVNQIATDIPLVVVLILEIQEEKNNSPKKGRHVNKLCISYLGHKLAQAKPTVKFGSHRRRSAHLSVILLRAHPVRLRALIMIVVGEALRLGHLHAVQSHLVANVQRNQQSCEARGGSKTLRGQCRKCCRAYRNPIPSKKVHRMLSVMGRSGHPNKMHECVCLDHISTSSLASDPSKKSLNAR